MTEPIHSALASLSKAKEWLGKAKTIDEVAAVRDKAEAVRLYAKARGMGLEMQNDAAEIKIRAERKGGLILKEMEKHPGGKGLRSHDATAIPVKLSDLGLTKSDSSRWQKSASIPERQFEKHIAEVREKQEELTTAGVLREARNRDIVQRRTRTPELPENKFRVIYADPPWAYGNTGFKQSAVSKYPTMTAQEVADLKVPSVCHGDAVLFLWVTNPILPDGLQVLNAWGFKYKVTMVWEKDRSPGLGWWVNSKHEFLLIGSRGKIGTPIKKPDSVFRFPVGKHSEKPEEVAWMIQEMFKGPYLELFARTKRRGWKSWGNEIESGSSPRPDGAGTP